MTPLPPPLGAGELVFWRLDAARHAASWDSGEGAYRAGGRWNTRGQRAVYAALDPATALVEVAVHKTFAALDLVPHVLSRARVALPAAVRVVRPDDIPNPRWLVPGMPSRGQQAFGDALLAASPFTILPSVVSRFSWNVIFDPAAVAGHYDEVEQTQFALDPRLHPPGK